MRKGPPQAGPFAFPRADYSGGVPAAGASGRRAAARGAAVGRIRSVGGACCRDAQVLTPGASGMHAAGIDVPAADGLSELLRVEWR